MQVPPRVKSAALVPPVLSEVRFSVPAPLLVSVIACAALVVDWTWLAKASDAADSEIVGVATAVALPVRITDSAGTECVANAMRSDAPLAPVAPVGVNAFGDRLITSLTEGRPRTNEAPASGWKVTLIESTQQGHPLPCSS